MSKVGDCECRVVVMETPPCSKRRRRIEVQRRDGAGGQVGRSDDLAVKRRSVNLVHFFLWC